MQQEAAASFSALCSLASFTSQPHTQCQRAISNRGLGAIYAPGSGGGGVRATRFPEGDGEPGRHAGSRHKAVLGPLGLPDHPKGLRSGCLLDRPAAGVAVGMRKRFRSSGVQGSRAGAGAGRNAVVHRNIQLQSAIGERVRRCDPCGGVAAGFGFECGWAGRRDAGRTCGRGDEPEDEETVGGTLGLRNRFGLAPRAHTHNVPRFITRF